MQGQGPIMIQYLLADANSPTALGTLVVSISRPPRKVSEIRCLINRHQELVDFNKYLLYKADIPFEDDLPAVLAPLGEPIPDVDLVSKHWPDGFSRDVLSIILNKPPETTGTVSSEPRQNIEVPSIGAHDDDEQGNYNTSTLAIPSQYKKFQAKEMKIFNGRPQEASGLPIGLFHPVFDSFQQRIASASFAPTALQLSNTLPLLTASQNIYDKETGPNSRTEALKPLLNGLLDLCIQNSGIPGTKSGGIIQGSNGTYLMIMEVNNEIGTGGCDPSVQGAVSFANYWGDHSSQWLRERCCCPSMILAIAGPWMCVLGGIMLKHSVIQPLTPFFLVGNNPSSPGQHKFVAKIFASLAKSLSELDDFYRGFKRSSGTRNPGRHLPHIQHFIRDGQRVDIEYKGFLVPEKAVFRAVAQPEGGEGYKVIVKFAESYNAAAHRLLAAMKLAPELIFISSEDPGEFKVAQRIMVVMKEVPCMHLSVAWSFPDCVLDDVSRALDALHQHNMVFGDLRPLNVLVVEDEQGRQTGGMISNFDWCGTAGQATYPIRIDLTIEWPEGVGPGLPMYPAHDREMLTRLSNM